MEATNSRSMQQASRRNETLETRGIFGNLSERAARTLAVLFTLGTVTAIGYSLDRLFTSLGA